MAEWQYGDMVVWKYRSMAVWQYFYLCCVHCGYAVWLMCGEVCAGDISTSLFGRAQDDISSVASSVGGGEEPPKGTCRLTFNPSGMLVLQ